MIQKIQTEINRLHTKMDMDGVCSHYTSFLYEEWPKMVVCVCSVNVPCVNVADVLFLCK